MAGYGKVSLTMGIVTSAMWSSGHEQIYYLCGYQHKSKEKHREHAFHKYMTLNIQMTDSPMLWTYTEIVNHSGH